MSVLKNLRLESWWFPLSRTARSVLGFAVSSPDVVASVAVCFCCCPCPVFGGSSAGLAHFFAVCLQILHARFPRPRRCVDLPSEFALRMQ